MKDLSGRDSLPSISTPITTTNTISIPETSDTTPTTTTGTTTTASADMKFQQLLQQQVQHQQEQERETNTLLFQNELQISQLSVSFLSKSLPVTVDEFYNMFLADAAPYSYSKYLNSEKMFVIVYYYYIYYHHCGIF